MKKITSYLIVLVAIFMAVLTSCDTDTSVTGVTLNRNTLTLAVGQEETLVATIIPDNATNRSVSWESDNPSVATVLHGVISARSVGTAVISVTTADGGKTDRSSVTVEAASIPVTGITMNIPSHAMEVGDTVMLIATVLPENASNRTVIWSASNASVRLENGRVIAMFPGQVIITATTQDGNRQVVCTINITPVPSFATNCIPVPNLPGFDQLPNGIGTASFLTDRTWLVGEHEWSDVVMASNCSDRTSFIGMSGGQGVRISYINCRSNPGFGDLFSWCAVVVNRNILCPDGWRLPTLTDFIELDRALGGDGETRPRFGVAMDPSILNRYVNEWGATFSGNVGANGDLGGQGGEVYYWKITEYEANSAGYFGLRRAGYNPAHALGNVFVRGAGSTGIGMTVRCIRQPRL